MPNLHIHGVVEQVADNALDGIQVMNDGIKVLYGYIPEIHLPQADALQVPHVFHHDPMLINQMAQYGAGKFFGTKAMLEQQLNGTAPFGEVMSKAFVENPIASAQQIVQNPGSPESAASVITQLADAKSVLSNDGNPFLDGFANGVGQQELS